jgi:hypothetical protein
MYMYSSPVPTLLPNSILCRILQVKYGKLKFWSKTRHCLTV